MAYSGMCEDNLIHELFGKQPKRFLDIGAGGAEVLSNTRFLLEQGWSGVWVDASYRSVPDLLARQKLFKSGQVEVIHAAISAKNMVDLNEADYAFHRIAVAEMNNGPILALFETLRSFTYEEIRISNTIRANLGKVVSEHEAILAAVKDMDPLAAFHKFREHIDTTCDRIVQKKEPKVRKPR